jgi:hypothetical protein
MDQTFDAADVEVGFHPAGYRIDKTASPMNRYTQWSVVPGQGWRDPKPVCFDSLPQKGWFKKDKFNWDRVYTVEGVPS